MSQCLIFCVLSGAFPGSGNSKSKTRCNATKQTLLQSIQTETKNTDDSDDLNLNLNLSI